MFTSTGLFWFRVDIVIPAAQHFKHLSPGFRAAFGIRSMEKLTQEQIADGLAGLPDWTLNGESIQRTFGFDDFKQSMEFVSRVADRAEAVQHHPDILVRYNKVTLTLSTHDAGGLSEKDLAFAADCDGYLVAS